MTALPGAVALAVLAAVLFAVAATLQSSAITTGPSAGGPPASLIRADGMRSLLRAPAWLAGGSLAALGSATHAGALVLAPVAIVQPLGTLAVPFAILIGAVRTGTRPPARLVIIVTVSLASLVGFVTLAATHAAAPTRPGIGAVVAATTAAATLAVALSLIAVRSHRRWLRCVAFAASSATAFGLVSALMRLVSLTLTTSGATDPVAVLIPTVVVAVALLGGSWAAQQAYVSGTPDVVVGCLTVIDPLVAVTLGTALLGERVAATATSTVGLVVCAGGGVGATLLMARHHPTLTTRPNPDASPNPGGVAGYVMETAALRGDGGDPAALDAQRSGVSGSARDRDRQRGAGHDGADRA